MDVTDSVVRIRRAFDAAFLRMCEAKNPEIAEDELSNLLSQIYRLRELVRKELGDMPFFAAMSVTPERQAAGGAVWVRTFDTSTRWQRWSQPCQAQTIAGRPPV